MIAHDSRLALGTVQFGLSYGVSNKNGKVTEDQVAEIIQFAHKSGIKALDTAVGYGSAEETLGEIGVHGFEVTTKLPAAPVDLEDGWVRKQLEGSLKRLRVENLHCVLLHDPNALLTSQGQAQFRQLLNAKAQGLVSKIGISIYDPDVLSEIENVDQVDIVQVPVNIFDRRANNSRSLEELSGQGAEIYARSVFLQGLLLMPIREQIARFPEHAEVFQLYKNWLDELGYSPQEASLGYVLGQGAITKVLVGVESRAQLADLLIIEKSSSEITPPVFPADELLLDPRRW